METGAKGVCRVDRRGFLFLEDSFFDFCFVLGILYNFQMVPTLVRGKDCSSCWTPGSRDELSLSHPLRRIAHQDSRKPPSCFGVELLRAVSRLFV